MMFITFIGARFLTLYSLFFQCRSLFVLTIDSLSRRGAYPAICICLFLLYR
jgi:hypothetical protein